MTTEEHILAVAADLLETEGVAAVTTRAVCKAAGVTAPTLYHHFGDKNGLLGAVITQGLNTFMARKRARRQTSDALSDLKRGWNSWIDFAAQRPQLFRLVAERMRADAGTTQEAFVMMRGAVERLAGEGRLTTDIDTAARAIWAGSNGVHVLFTQGDTLR
ncbi:helix-turn-helix domain-containing protein [Xanthomonas arboricola pv. corylina]|nr:helix-turn-helix domain-containing protein [Xanthomonas arboricola pv. corylina]